MSLWGMFGKDPKDLFLEFSPVGSHWRVVTWNFDLDDPSKRKWTVESHSEKEKIIIWEHNHNNDVTFFEGRKLIRKRRISAHTDELRTLMNLSIHSTLKYGLESNHEFMLTPVPGATTMDIQNESRALQWIQTSFGTLSKALENLKEDKSLILTAACFSGTVPDTKEEVLRVIAFNLDIFYYLKEDKSLQIVIFNDKNQGHGKSREPTFQQIIKVTKPQFYDEISRLLHLMAQVGEIS